MPPHVAESLRGVTGAIAPRRVRGGAPARREWAYEVAVLMHMHFCPPARSGVATRHRAHDRRGITRPAQAPLLGAEGWGHRSGGEALPLRGAGGGAPPVSTYPRYTARLNAIRRLGDHRHRRERVSAHHAVSGGYTPSLGDATFIVLQITQCTFNPSTVAPYLTACYKQAAEIISAAGLTALRRELRDLLLHGACPYPQGGSTAPPICRRSIWRKRVPVSTA